MIWRFDKSENWQVFGVITVTFGDKPAAILLEIAIELCADSAEKELPDKVRKDRYVNDGTTGVSERRVRELMGNKDKEEEKAQVFVLGKVGFKIKG